MAEPEYYYHNFKIEYNTVDGKYHAYRNAESQRTDITSYEGSTESEVEKQIDDANDVGWWGTEDEGTAEGRAYIYEGPGHAPSPPLPPGIGSTEEWKAAIEYANRPELGNVVAEAVNKYEGYKQSYERGEITPRDFAKQIHDVWVQAVYEIDMLGYQI